MPIESLRWAVTSSKLDHQWREVIDHMNEASPSGFRLIRSEDDVVLHLPHWFVTMAIVIVASPCLASLLPPHAANRTTLVAVVLGLIVLLR